MHTNPGVVEQYKKRELEVIASLPSIRLYSTLSSFQIESLSATIEEKEGRAERLERTVKTAKVRRQSHQLNIVDPIFDCRIIGSPLFKNW